MFRKLVALLAICMLLAAGYGCGGGGGGETGAGADDPYDVNNLRRMRDAGEQLGQKELDMLEEADRAAEAGAGSAEPTEAQ